MAEITQLSFRLGSKAFLLWSTLFLSLQPAYAQSSRTVSGIIAAEQYAEISAPRNGVVTMLPVELGQSVKSGDILAQLECSAEEARGQTAAAELVLAQHDLKVQKKTRRKWCRRSSIC